MPFAAREGDVATPDALPIAVAVLVPVVVNLALAPLFGAVNVTLAPGITLPKASLTRTTSGLAKFALIRVL